MRPRGWWWAGMAVACLVKLVLVHNDTRELMRLVLARAEDIVAAGEGGHLDPLGHRGRRLVKAGAVGGGGRDGGVEDAARLRLAREAGLVVCAAGQLPVYLMWIPCPNAEKYVPHSSIVNVIWQPVVTALVGSRMSITHFAEVSSEQSALA